MTAEKKMIYSLNSCQSFQPQLGISVYPFLYAEVNAKKKKKKSKKLFLALPSTYHAMYVIT